MYVAGIVPEDAPDPMLGIVEQLRQMPIPILGLVPQPNVADWGGLGVQSARHDGVFDEMTATVSYTLWRNPDDRANPSNLAELDDRTRAALDQEPPWPRPQWILDAVGRARYPVLWEAVRTTWSRDPSRQDVRAALVDHVNHILVNQFGGSYPSSPLYEPDGHPLVDERSSESGRTIVIDGAETDGVRIDTDPDVVGVGADLGGGGMLTAVVPRDELRFIRLEFAARPLD
ncbi:MAG: hypothetical protein ABIO06_05640 [Pseudolysinimonas sp.]